MNRFFAASAGVVATFLWAIAAQAAVTVGGTPGGANGDYSSFPGVTTIDFNAPDSSYPAGAISGDHAVVSGSMSGQYAAPPLTNTSPYLTVPSSQSSGSATIDLGGYYNYFGLFWGSIDEYNTLTFLDDGFEVFSYTGSQAAALIPTPPDGNQSIAAYFNFHLPQQFNTVRLSSTQYAFETDNHAFGNVPVPATAALLALGGCMLIGVRRRSALAHGA